jgi:DNA-binding NarL/FixJ family response regulator
MTSAVAAREGEATIALRASTVAVGISAMNPMRVALERTGASADNLSFVGPDDERAEVVFVDCPMDEWVAVCGGLATGGAKRHVIVCAPDDSVSTIRAALGAGADGCVVAGDTVDEVIAAIRAVVAGGAWLTRSRLRSLLDEPRAPSGERDGVVASPLTARERDVLMLLAAGATQRHIAKALFISPHTVRTHVRNLMRKLRARTCAEAVARACDIGLITPEASAASLRGQ